MTYGVYSKDIHGVSLAETDLETAKRYCYGDKVVCSEKDITIGFEIAVKFCKEWSWRIRPRLQYANLGFIHLTWRVMKYKWADKVVWSKESEAAHGND